MGVASGAVKSLIDREPDRRRLFLATRSLSRRRITSPLSKTRGRVPSFCILYLKLGVRPFGWFSRSATRNAGVGRPVTGHRLAPSPSIRSATSWFGRQPHKSSFPDRSANRSFPRRPGNAKATARNAGDGRSRATWSHAQRAWAHAADLDRGDGTKAADLAPPPCGDRGCAGRRRAQRQPDSRDLINPSYG